LLHDAHPDYLTSRWARARGLPRHPVWHHHAHASALLAEHGVDEAALVFAWDGVGLGEDGTLWGGETLAGRPGHWRRCASLRPFRLPGGDRAGRSPWRSAAALCWETGREFAAPDPIVRQAWERGLNAPVSSAAGRVFDAASALLLGVAETSFEGQGPMWLEAVARPCSDWPSLPIAADPSGVLRIDWEPLLPFLGDARKSRAERAWGVHAALADAIAKLAEQAGGAGGVVGLTGGVFQNRLLSELASERLAARGCRVLLAGTVPCNDGGLSYGQVADFLGHVG
jgi:hydrogenase maturation protein HypF